MLRVILAAACIVCTAVPLAGIGARAPALALAALLPVLAVGAIAKTIRRLHDRGHTGWWLAPNLVVWVAGLAPMETWADRYPLPILAYAMAADGFALWWLVEAFGRPGTRCANRYGAATGGD